MAAGMAIPASRSKVSYRQAFASTAMGAVVHYIAVGLAYAGMSSGVQPFIYFQF